MMQGERHHLNIRPIERVFHKQGVLEPKVLLDLALHLLSAACSEAGKRCQWEVLLCIQSEGFCYEAFGPWNDAWHALIEPRCMTSRCTSPSERKAPCKRACESPN